MSEYVGLLASLSEDSEIATEGKIGDLLRGFKEKIGRAIAKAIELVQKIAANIAAAASRLPSQVSKADSRVKPVVQGVDKMVAMTLVCFKDIKKATTKGVGTNEFESWKKSMDDNYANTKKMGEAVCNYCDELKRLAGTNEHLSKAGASAASVGMKGWLGKLNIVDRQLGQMSDNYQNETGDMTENPFQQVSKQVYATISVITTASQALHTASRNGKQVDNSTKELSGGSVGQKALPGSTSSKVKEDIDVQVAAQQDAEAKSAELKRQKDVIDNAHDNSRRTNAQRRINENKREEAEAEAREERGRKTASARAAQGQQRRENIKKQQADARADAVAQRRAAAATRIARNKNAQDREDRRNNRRPARSAARDSFMDFDASNLAYAVEAMIAAVEYRTQGYYEPEDEIGEAVESAIQEELVMQELEDACATIED